MPKKKKKPQKKGGGKKAARAEERAIKKKRSKVAEDRTFGLKNKKKSRKVQRWVKGVKSQATNPGGRKHGVLSAAERKKLRKLEERARQRELERYFGKGTYTAARKTEGGISGAGAGAGQAETMDDLEGQIEAERELTLVEVIEKERAKIVDGTPVTEDSFRQWKEFRKRMKRTEEKRRERLRAALTGRELFLKDQGRFGDDEDAVEAENLKIDEDLFLDDLDQAGMLDDEDDAQESFEDFLRRFPEDGSYEQMTWNAVEKKTPKSLLMDILRLRKMRPPRFTQADNDGSGGFKMKCCFDIGQQAAAVMGEASGAMEIETPGFIKKKKVAEHTCAILVIKFFLLTLDPKERGEDGDDAPSAKAGE